MMEKKKWTSIGISKVLFNTIRRLIGRTGDPSVAERVISFVVAVHRDALHRDGVL